MIKSREGVVGEPRSKSCIFKLPAIGTLVSTSSTSKLQGIGAQKARSPEPSDLRSRTTARHAIPSPRSRSELQTQSHPSSETFSELSTSETSGESTAQASHPHARRAPPARATRRGPLTLWACAKTPPCIGGGHPHCCYEGGSSNEQYRGKLRECGEARPTRA